MDWFTGNEKGGRAPDTAANSLDAGQSDGFTGSAGRWLATQINGQEGRQVLWAPVWIVTGSLAYFLLQVEPPVWLGAILALMAVALFAVVRLGRADGLAVATGFMLAGFAVAQLSTHANSTKVVPASTGKIEMTGWIAEISRGRGKRARLTVDVDELGNVRPEYWPGKVRLSVSTSSLKDHVRGDHVRFNGMLYPPLTPAIPGGWDYGMIAWFDGIGAGGRVLGELQAGGKPPRRGWYDQVAALRTTIAQRIRASLPEREAGFAIALVTGERAGLDTGMREALQLSGLAHVLAISGLHMSLVAGGVFWLVRALLALWPALALRFPVKKIAALAGLAAAFFYLLISGQAIATQRAFIMLFVMFLAVLLGRSAISMRNLAVAALIVVAITPHAVLTPSFQMSFLAVMGLIAGYEHAGALQSSLRERFSSGSIAGAFAGRLVLGLVALSATTIIASVFTALPAAYHFNRYAPWSLPANVLAMPIVTTMVMPGAVASVVAMPLGLENWPLQFMASGLRMVQAIATMVAGWPASANVVGAMVPALAFASVLGLCFLCLWRGALRWAGAIVSLVLAGLAIVAGPRADILVERTGTTVAARNGEGDLVPVYDRRGKFAVERWLLADGDRAAMKEAAKRPGWNCDAGVCRANTRGKTVLWLGREAKPPADCRQVDVLISANPLRRACGRPANGKVQIDRFDVWRNGAYALTIDADGSVQVNQAKAASGVRPWVYEAVSRRKVLITPPPPWQPKVRSKEPRTKQDEDGASDQSSDPATD